MDYGELQILRCPLRPQFHRLRRPAVASRPLRLMTPSSSASCGHGKRLPIRACRRRPWPLANVRAAQIAIYLIVICSAGPALASWQYTRWGMTLSQVIAASRGSAFAYQGTADEQVGGKLRLLAAAKYHSGSIDFKVRFYFDRDGALNLISLTPNPYDCSALQSALEDKYGEPDRKDDVFSVWTDAANNNSILLFKLKYCYIDYSPISNPDSKGL